MKKILLLIFLPLQLFAQNTIGLPDVINYTKQSYRGGLQNWDIKQDINGIIYVANNEGLLSFDGTYWNLYPLPNKTIVRSVAIGSDHKIYVGGQDELGYFSPSENGSLIYYSLVSKIPINDRSFGDVWDIVSYQNQLLFRTSSRIFKLSGNQFSIDKSENEWTFLGVYNNKLIAQDYKKGLKQLINHKWVKFNLPSELPINDPVTGILPIRQNNAIITTLKSGLFILNESQISSLKSTNNTFFKNERIYAATKVNTEWLALATSNSGVYIVDTKGNIIQSFSQTEGLQNNNVLSIFLDNQANLWLGLDNGIDFIAHNSAIKQINPFLQGGSGYTALIDNTNLFLGTSNGLYNISLQQKQDLSFSKGRFVPVKQSKGQTWGLAKLKDQILLGHHEGAFSVENNQSTSLTNQSGFWNFSAIPGTQQMVAGNYKGLVVFDYQNGQFKPTEQISGFQESSRYVAIDNESNIWVSHPYHGVYKISRPKNGKSIIKAFNKQNGLPSIMNNHVYKIKNEILIATDKGIYSYDKIKQKFSPTATYQHMLGNQSIRYLKEDTEGNVWFIHEKSLGVIDFSSKKPSVTYLPELNNKMLSGFEFIYPLNSQNIFLGGEKGFYHINYQKYKQTIPKLKVQIRTVRIISDTDSLLFGGYFNEANQRQIQNRKLIKEVENKWKNIRFEFASTLFAYQANLEYSFRLKGFDNNWSEWTKRTEKEYTNLPGGTYTFEVKVRNNLGNESASNQYTFKMRPPWYLTNLAKIAYFLLFISGIGSLNRWQRKKFKLQQARHEEEQKRLSYIHELEMNKTESELLNLKNEILEAEISYKNSELASSAMHLVKKSELLTKSKEELSQVMKSLDNPQAISELRKMIKSLSADENMDKEWENFTKHFDKVHSNFLSDLKVKHPNITPNELKLCAYLRMNLSTKEIAQLINISVRGVEISRYRLRKKLQIPTETTLFDYLINFQSKS